MQNGREGILAINDATFTLDDTTVQNNTSHGIELVGASADARNITSRQNGRVGVIIARNSLIDLTDTTLPHNLSGLVVFSNSVVRLFGTNRMNESRTQGVTVGLGGVAFAIGSTLLANDNGAEGMLLLQDGKVQLIGGTLEANNNASDGIRLLQNSSMILGIEEFGVSGKAGGIMIRSSDAMNQVPIIRSPAPDDDRLQIERVQRVLFGPGVNSEDRLGRLLAITRHEPTSVFWPVFDDAWSVCDDTWHPAW